MVLLLPLIALLASAEPYAKHAQDVDPYDYYTSLDAVPDAQIGSRSREAMLEGARDLLRRIPDGRHGARVYGEPPESVSVLRERNTLILKWHGYTASFKSTGSLTHFSSSIGDHDPDAEQDLNVATRVGINAWTDLFGPAPCHVVNWKRVQRGVLTVSLAYLPRNGRYLTAGGVAGFELALDDLSLVSGSPPTVPPTRPGDVPQVDRATVAARVASAWNRFLPQVPDVIIEVADGPYWQGPGGMNWPNEYTPEQRECVRTGTLVLQYGVNVIDRRSWDNETLRYNHYWVAFVDAITGNVMSFFPMCAVDGGKGIALTEPFRPRPGALFGEWLIAGGGTRRLDSSELVPLADAAPQAAAPIGRRVSVLREGSASLAVVDELGSLWIERGGTWHPSLLSSAARRWVATECSSPSKPFDSRNPKWRRIATASRMKPPKPS